MYYPKKILGGIKHAKFIFKKNPIAGIVIATLKGNGSGIIKPFARLARYSMSKYTWKTMNNIISMPYQQIPYFQRKVVSGGLRIGQAIGHHKIHDPERGALHHLPLRHGLPTHNGHPTLHESGAAFRRGRRHFREGRGQNHAGGVRTETEEGLELRVLRRQRERERERERRQAIGRQKLRVDW